MVGTAPRVALVVPGSDVRKIDKALALDVDEVVLDLEDAVAVEAKDAARARVCDLLRGGGRPPAAGSLAVRVNQIGSRWCHRDVLDIVAAAVGPVTLVVPKVDSPDDVAFVDRLVRGVLAERAWSGGAVPDVRIDVLIETAAGLRALDRTAVSSRLLRALIVGYADLGADLGRDPGGDPTIWDPVRTAVVTAARAAALVAIDGPWLGVAADAAFGADRQRSRAHGFDGTWVIHPAQAPSATQVFSPSAEEVEWAGRVVRALAGAVASGQGAVSLDGQMLDEAVAVRARATLARVRGERSR